MVTQKLDVVRQELERRPQVHCQIKAPCQVSVTENTCQVSVTENTCETSLTENTCQVSVTENTC